MKLLKLLAFTGCASLIFTSCDPSVGAKRQLMYNHTTLTDSEGYNFFQKVGGIAAYEAEYADFVSNNTTDAKAKDLAEKSKSLYIELLPILDSLATQFQVDFPIKGAERFDGTVFELNSTLESEVDSLTQLSTTNNTANFDSDKYVQHVQDKSKEVYDQFQRLSRNTSKVLKTFAAENIEKVEALYTASGGTIDHHAHH